MSGNRGALLLATWGGCGYAPVAPGTVASIVAVALGYGLVAGCGFSPLWLGVLSLLLLWPASWAAGVAETHFSRKDPSQVVVDEVVGQWLALTVVEPGAWNQWLAALLLFRLFDILKPFPIRRLERISGGFGVVADDAAAGLCAMIVLVGLHRFLSQ